MARPSLGLCAASSGADDPADVSGVLRARLTASRSGFKCKYFLKRRQGERRRANPARTGCLTARTFARWHPPSCNPQSSGSMPIHFTSHVPSALLLERRLHQAGRRYRPSHLQTLGEPAPPSNTQILEQCSSPDPTTRSSENCYASEAVCPVCRGIHRSAAFASIVAGGLVPETQSQQPHEKSASGSASQSWRDRNKFLNPSAPARL